MRPTREQIDVPKSRLKALVVDDEKNVRALLIGWLFRDGFLCNEAEDGAKALRELQHSRYDLVVADLRMPNRHGYALCQAILEQTDRPPLVVVTGVDDPRLWQDLKSRGVDHIFSKPLDAAEFLTRVRELTQSRQWSSPSDEGRMEIPVEPSAEDLDPLAEGRAPSVALLLHDERRARDIALALKRQTFLPFVVENTDALCSLAQSRHLELLVMENLPFGFLSPQELVSRLRSRAASTDILLLGGDNTSPESVAEWAGSAKLLSRGATNAEVVQAVRANIAAMNRGRGLVSAQARELVTPLSAPSTLERSLLKLAGFLQQPDREQTPDRLEKELAANADATEEILRLAKGASAGSRGQNISIKEAIARLGVSRSAALLVTAGIKGAEKALLRRMPLPLRDWYQRRSNLNAALASVVAQQHCGLSGDLAFVLGLLQDIGIAALAAAFEDRYARLVTRARSCGPAHLHVVERADLRIEHSEISAALVEQWGLPNELVNVVRFHHMPTPSGRGGTTASSTVVAMQISESISDFCDNRHPTRRQEVLRQLSACDEDSVISAEACAKLAAETAHQFRAPFVDESWLKTVLCELVEPATVAARP
jgi:HD-like signal output (HDOD) protein/CheY-like chemotaxis protein